MKIVHVTSAHPILDVRIFYKECLALHQAGHEVHIVAPESSLTFYKGITLHSISSEVNLSRWQRLFKIYQLAKAIPADIYHFHDPEFILFALLLKIKGHKVIYDVHEDTPKESRSFNKKKPLVALLKYYRWSFLEKLAILFFDGFVCATTHIAKKFPLQKTSVVRNFVMNSEFDNSSLPQSFDQRSNIAIYVGGLMRIRGIEEMLKVINLIPTKYNPELKLIGKFSPKHLEQEVIGFPGWNKTSSLGWLSRESLLPHLYSAKVGLVLLHPEENFKDALPIKLFEYMAAGLPVIVSNFPLWREIVEQAKCGFVVDPMSITEIIEAMIYIFEHPVEAQSMGNKGREAVKKYYNWESESMTLIKFYHQFAQQ